MRFALVGVVTVLLVGWPSPVIALPQSAEVEIENVDEVLIVGATGARVLLLNTSAVESSVTASVTARTDDGQRARLAVTPSSAPIAGAGELELRITRTSLVDLAESAIGWLVVVAGKGQEQTVTRRPIRVVVPSGTPGTNAWHAEWAPLPGTHSGALDGALLVTEGGCGGVEVPHSDRPVLVNGAATGRVSLGCRDRSIVLTAEDFPSWGYGDYTGTIVVGETPVAVSVRRTAPVWIAVGLLLAGLVLALLVQGWVGDRRDHRLRRARLAELEKRTSGIAGLNQPMKDSVETLRARLEDLACKGPRGWLPWPDGHNAERIEEFDSDVVRLTTLADMWPAFLERKQEIEIPDDRTWAPGLYASLERLRNLADTTDGLLKQVAEANAAADALTVVTVAKQTAVRITAGENSEEPRIRRLAGKARLRHNSLRSQLTRITSGVEAKSLTQTIAAVVELCDQIPPQSTAPGTIPGRARSATAETGAGLPPIMTPVVALLDRLRDWGETLISETAARGTNLVIRDVWIVVLLTFVGIWSGLALLYYGKPWGTPNDLIAAAVWGFATPTLVAPVLAAVRRVGSRSNSQEPTGSGGRAQ